MKNTIKTKNDDIATQKNVTIKVQPFTKLGEPLACKEIFLHKYDGKNATILYKSIQSLKLNREQKKLLMQFINSL